jgi:hypothetical protein
MAHEDGYHDQLHMVHDFQSSTGETRTKTLDQVEMLFRAQIDTMRSGGLSANADAEDRLVLILSAFCRSIVPIRPDRRQTGDAGMNRHGGVSKEGWRIQ